MGLLLFLGLWLLLGIAVAPLLFGLNKPEKL